MFEIYEITSFNKKQIQEYVEKWFSLDFDLRPNERTEKAKRFMVESERVSDLRSNSLMLSLMCNIYKQENYIPENRPKIYQKCAEMLFKKWDRHRGINPEITIQDSKMESLISYLAYWIYTNESSKEGASEEELIRKATEYLHGPTYEDFDEAEKVAKDFVNFSKGRAWIFTVFGTSNNQDLYQFTHRTFLEYFTSNWFCRNYEDTIELTNKLIPRICKREWDVVAQLVFQMRGESTESATDKILTTILKVAKKSKEVERENLLSFAARSLEFMAPNPNIVKEITTDCFEFSFYLGKNNIKKMKLLKDFRLYVPEREPPIELTLDLRYSVRENRTKVIETLTNLIIDRIKGNNEFEAILAAEIIFELANGKISKSFDEKEKLYWSEKSYFLLKECYKYNKTLFEKHIHLCIQSYKVLFNSKIEIILGLHGLEGILSHYSNILSLGTRTSGIGQNLLSEIIELGFYTENSIVDLNLMDHCEKISQDLKKIGEFCLEHPLPIDVREKYLTGTEMYGTWLFYPRIRNQIIHKNKIFHPYCHSDPTAIFGEFCLYAIFFELNSGSQNQLKSIINFMRLMNLKYLTNIFLIRLGIVEYIELENELDILGLTKRHKEFIANWAQKKICFLSIDNKA